MYVMVSLHLCMADSNIDMYMLKRKLVYYVCSTIS
jgi:hypothetical protein